MSKLCSVHQLLDSNVWLSFKHDRNYPVLIRKLHQSQNFAVGESENRVFSDKDTLQIDLDVHIFSPEEISVKTVDGFVIIEGKHEEKEVEHGLVSRQFTTKYKLPEYCDPAAVEAKFSSDFVLKVIFPKVVPASKNERAVPIVKTGPVRRRKSPIPTPRIQRSKFPARVSMSL